MDRDIGRLIRLVSCSGIELRTEDGRLLVSGDPGPDLTRELTEHKAEVIAALESDYWNFVARRVLAFERFGYRLEPMGQGLEIAAEPGDYDRGWFERHREGVLAFLQTRQKDRTAFPPPPPGAEIIPVEGSWPCESEGCQGTVEFTAGRGRCPACSLFITYVQKGYAREVLGQKRTERLEQKKPKGRGKAA